LPYDAEVEYLQSSGTQYIELPYGFEDTDEIEIICALGQDKSDKYLVSPKTWNNNQNRFAMAGSYMSHFTIGYGNSLTNKTYLSPKTTVDYDFHTWKYANHLFEVTDLGIEIDVSTIIFGGITTSLKLFYGYDANTKGKIKSFIHKKGGVVVLDLIAVRVGTTGYLYDSVSGQLFGDANQNGFAVGQDKIT
jgi:hypothetical protein